MKLYSPLAALLCSPWLLLSFAPMAAEPQLVIQLTPVTVNQQVVALAVKETYHSDDSLPLLAISRTLGPLLHIDQRISELQGSDSAGAFSLVATDAVIADALGKMPQAWKSSRPTQGPVSISYRVQVSTETIPGPTWELRSEALGLSAAGNTFLLLPQNEQPYQVSVTWELTALGPKASAIDSLPSAGIATPQRIASSYFMAGQLVTRGNDSAAARGFRAASTFQSQAFTQPQLLGWAENAYVKFSDFFGFAQLPPFTVLFRSNPMISKSGTALPEALMVAANPNIPLPDMQQILAHEMVHVFLHGLEPASWFQEGLAVFYENRTRYALGLVSSDQYLHDVNTTLQTYYSNVKKDMPMADATAAFWSDARARLQPYFRGALYFMVTDSRLRKVSHNQVTLDDVLRAFLQQRVQGKAVSERAWLALLEPYIGAAAQQDYAALQQGGLLVPEVEALGPCFTRQTHQIPEFELGFEIASLMQQPRVIRGLDSQSAAAKAGLRNGDKIAKSVGLDEQQGRLGEPMTLLVERDGQQLPITFIPTGKATQAYQWVKHSPWPGDAQCRQ